jgi:hypothetical protein
MKHGLLITIAAREVDERRRTLSVFPFGQSERRQASVVHAPSAFRCHPVDHPERHIAGIL